MGMGCHVWGHVYAGLPCAVTSDQPDVESSYHQSAARNPRPLRRTHQQLTALLIAGPGQNEINRNIAIVQDIPHMK